MFHMSCFYMYYLHVEHLGDVLVVVHLGVVQVLEDVKNTCIQLALRN